ncbi:MAG: hydrogenase maturation nickel metallochaperone HypA/HybF [Nocardioidaceae bacterium]
MHELSIAESVVEAIHERIGDARVARVRLRVGALSGVVPDALSFCFELATSGTPLEGAELVLVEQAGQAHCRSCGADFALPDLIALCACGSADVEIRAGRELQIVSVDLVKEVDRECAAPADADRPTYG